MPVPHPGGTPPTVPSPPPAAAAIRSGALPGPGLRPPTSPPTPAAAPRPPRLLARLVAAHDALLPPAPPTHAMAAAQTATKGSASQSRLGRRPPQAFSSASPQEQEGPLEEFCHLAAFCPSENGFLEKYWLRLASSGRG